MRISEIMAVDVETVDLDATIEEAAQVMSDADVGCVPVVDDGKVMGIVTDRDIVVRAVSEGLPPSDTPVTEIMTRVVVHCYEDDDVEKAAKLMAAEQVRRVFVYDRDGLITGVVSLGDLAQTTDKGGAVLKEVSRRGMPPEDAASRAAAGRDGAEAMDTLVKGELSAIETYKQALRKVGYGTWPGAELLRIETEHETAAALLKERIRRRGMEPPQTSGLWGAWSKAIEGAAKVFGGKAAIKALKVGEEHGVHEYETALRDESLDPEIKALIRRTLLPQTRAHIPVLERVLSEV